ncbi:hypothetical protein M9458_037166, partial [Cirrhinus mrigala]
VSFVCSLVEYWAYALGWLMALSSILLVPGWALGKLFAGKGSLKQVRRTPCSSLTFDKMNQDKAKINANLHN